MGDKNMIKELLTNCLACFVNPWWVGVGVNSSFSMRASCSEAIFLDRCPFYRVQSCSPFSESSLDFTSFPFYVGNLRFYFIKSNRCFQKFILQAKWQVDSLSLVQILCKQLKASMHTVGSALLFKEQSWLCGVKEISDGCLPCVSLCLPCRHQSESDLPLAVATGIRPEWTKEKGLLPMVPTWEIKSR